MKKQTVLIPLNADQRRFYESYATAIRADIYARILDVGIERSQMAVLAGLIRLRQICCDPRLLGLFGEVPRGAKLDVFTGMVADLLGEGRKIIVFSQFVEMQKLIVGEMNNRGIPHLWMHGGTKNRGELVQQFQSKSGPSVFLISLKAGGDGVDLTSADTIIHYDPWWDRPRHTHILSESATEYLLICTDTIEARVGDFLQQRGHFDFQRAGQPVCPLSLGDVEVLLP